MQTLKAQITKDIKTISTKLVELKKVTKKMTLKSWMMLGGFAFVTVGLLLALVVSRQSSENRSDASGQGLQYYFTPASAVLTQNTAGVLQPVQNVELKINAGRPVVSYSFVMRLTDAAGAPVSDSVWQQVAFQPNPKFINHSSVLLSSTYPGAKLFAGTIGQQPGGVTRLESTVTNGYLGAFTFTPLENQPDLRLSMFVIPGKPQANSVYQLGRLLTPPAADGEEVITIPNQFNLHNPFLVVGSPTPTPQGAVVKKATLQYAVSNGAEWRQLDARFNDFNNGGTVKSLIRLADIDPSWRVEGLSPAFRLRIKNAQGAYRQTTIGGQSTNVLVNFTPNGTLAEGTFWVNWKVIEEAGVKYIQKPNTTDRLRFESGDTIEVTINLHRQQSGVSYTCKETDELVVAPIGRPEEQQVMGPCVNDSLVTVTYGAGLAPGTCQCDLGVVMDSACAAATVATCTSQPVCACLPETPAATPTPLVSAYRNVNFMTGRVLQGADNASGANPSTIELVYPIATTQSYLKLSVANTINATMHPYNSGWSPKIYAYTGGPTLPEPPITSSPTTGWVQRSVTNMFAVNYEKVVNGYRYICMYDQSLWYQKVGETTKTRILNDFGQPFTCPNSIIEVTEDYGGAPPPAPTATLTPTPSSCPVTQIPASQWVGPGNSSAACSATGMTFTWKDPYTNEYEWRIYTVTASGVAGTVLGTVPASSTATKTFTYNPTGFNPRTDYKIKIRAIYRYQSGTECYQEAQISKLCQP
ncbi:MAG TPA: hypothetical protein PKH60_02305 [Candidatus Woesebacteria bacterium]|nr:hypothetical protein [Candidatus Woesebacteria bacterium]